MNKIMGVDMSLVVRNDFRQRKDIEATVSKLTETTEMLNRRLKTDELLLDFNYDENYFLISIRNIVTIYISI